MNAARLLAMVALGASWCYCQTGPSLQVSSTNISFVAVAGGSSPPAQLLRVISSDGSPQSFGLLVDGGAAGTQAPSWISATPPFASTPAEIRLSVDPSNLTSGTYSARIQLTDAQGHTSVAPFPVSLQVNSATSQLLVSTNLLRLNALTGATSVTGAFLVQSTGPVNLSPFSATASSSPVFLRANFDDGCQQNCIVRVTAATNALPPGAYLGAIHVTSGIGTANIPVSLFIPAPGPGFSAYPSAVEFDAREGNGSSDTRTITILNTSASVLNWVADVTPTVPWLTVTPASGSIASGASGTLTLGVNPGIMGQGTYAALLRLTATGFSPNMAVYVPTTLRLASAASSPIPLLSAGGLLLTATNFDASGATQPLTLNASASTAVNYQSFTESSGATSNWLSAAPSRGTVSTALPGALSVSGSTFNLGAGIYTGAVTFSTGSLDLRTLNVTLSIVEEQTPFGPAAPCTPVALHIVETGLVNDFSLSMGSAAPLTVTLLDDCGNPVNGGYATATFSSGDPGLSLLPVGSGVYEATWIPGSATGSLPGGSMRVGLYAEVPGLLPASTDLIGSVSGSTNPVLGAGGTLNNLNPVVGTAVAAGSVVQIFGQQFGSATSSATLTNGQLPTILNGVSVTIGGIASPLYFVSPNQINAQLPAELAPGQYQIVVNANGVFSSPDTVNVAAVQPGLAADSKGVVIAQDVNFQLLTATHPAHAGDVVILYLVGMGATNPPVPSGLVSPRQPLATVAAQPTVTINGETSQVIFAGLTPDSVGLYQIDVMVPADAPAGNLNVVVTQSGVSSNTATLPVK